MKLLFLFPPLAQITSKKSKSLAPFGMDQAEDDFIHLKTESALSCLALKFHTKDRTKGLKI